MKVIPDIMAEISQVMALVDESQLDAAMPYLAKDKRIFVIGAGRSGFQAKGFAMRLMHIGYTDYVMGETITPSIQKGDTWVAVSGSGTTKSIIADTEAAKKLGLNIVAFTSAVDSPLAKLADAVVIVPGATKTGAGVKSIQLLSTLFDQTVHITLDALTLKLAKRDDTSNADALHEHVNVE
ncbi:sugar phosphate isomerase [Lacticaseibacillus zeae DSM 20178 = KCTC 3804]|jgi:6-phospho-3-hexuloisomerase|uniref:6-phospho-3-hexuloisomerase n=2 Tax=Lacticaseibacillus zeae TaxID=57037 RepID=A0A5R8LW30_LACZE|nr:6-phospho-3-hexuloisomerase [Lacticaseibacillus zeae]KRK13115.1 sugar phosphate isomerase [Lacticaseibacillus zeae DSM 20178 = KCTC 3804]OLS10643.1 6-phospho 3-hexuloisomerase [Lacticaseibacillus casei]QVI31945.1 6-phospho-3-hexuloisomerase [Lacticaseibacillus zeae]TLF41486.1 6-phospho-3-hexuloisomerase [Lacticaseibacillus zeae]